MSFTFLLFYFRFCDIINTIISNFFKISEIFVEVIRLNDESARKEKRGMDTGALCYRRYLDGDESVSVSDLVKYRKILLNIETLSGDDIIIADVNADESLDIRDLIRIKKWLAGMAVALGQA